MFRVQEQNWKQISQKTFSYPKKKFGKEKRSFLPFWYNEWTCNQLHNILRLFDILPNF